MGLWRNRKQDRQDQQAQAEHDSEQAAAKADYERAVAEARATDGMVCSTVLSSGRPVYFVVPKDAPDASIEAFAFRLREGRHLTEGERILQSMIPKAEKIRTRLQDR